MRRCLLVATAMLAGSVSGCVATNEAFEGPGLSDSVDAHDMDRWPTVERGWEVSSCDIAGGAGSSSHGRAGRPDTCGDGRVPVTRAELVSAEVPVEGLDVELRFSTRVALPTCPGL